jgi:hypothetical protein
VKAVTLERRLYFRVSTRLAKRVDRWCDLKVIASVGRLRAVGVGCEGDQLVGGGLVSYLGGELTHGVVLRAGSDGGADGPRGGDQCGLVGVR